MARISKKKVAVEPTETNSVSEKALKIKEKEEFQDYLQHHQKEITLKLSPKELILTHVPPLL